MKKKHESLQSALNFCRYLYIYSHNYVCHFDAVLWPFVHDESREFRAATKSPLFARNASAAHRGSNPIASSFLWGAASASLETTIIGATGTAEESTVGRASIDCAWPRARATSNAAADATGEGKSVCATLLFNDDGGEFVVAFVDETVVVVVIDGGGGDDTLVANTAICGCE